LHRARQPLGKRLHRELQRSPARRAARRRNLLHSPRGPNRHRELAAPLQHDQAARIARIQAASTGGICPCLRRVAGCATPTGSAGHASATASLKLTFHLDHSVGANHPSRVRQRYGILAYYIQLLNLQGPMRSRSEDIAAAIKTYQLVGESIARSDAKFEGEVQASFVQSLRDAFSKSEEELRALLRQVGIDPRLLAASVIEESLASNMLFYGAETRVTNVNDMLWCCFPFCFRRPT